MFKYIVVAATALFVFQNVMCKPKGTTKAEQSQLTELAASAQAIVNNVTETLKGNLPDSKKVVDTLNTNSQNLATSVQQVVDKIKLETKNHQGDIEATLKQIEKNLSDTSKKLKEITGDDVAAKAKQMKENLDKGLKDAVAQAEKLIKTVEPDAKKFTNDLNQAAKSLLDQIVEVGNNLKEQVKTLEKTR